ncbi:hypothetical protein JCM10908_000582 [Rhodotorula pacifica]|uniref:uncharacterized protein n=1 Tax=Rhodotorula pacifica TaxID=1495444 RepID=UPI0031813AFC
MAALRLPAELWDHVLLQLDPDDLQHTTLNLARALGHRVAISRAVWWRHLRVTREGQAWQCIAALRKEDKGTSNAVESLQVQVWRDDPQMLVNLALQLPAVRSINLTVGPVAAPEHIEELLDPVALRRNQSGRFKQLEQLAFRFNPYCAERSYYTFLAGAYFDVAPLSLARMHTDDLPRLRRLSFVQDLPPTHGTVKKETPAFGLHQVQDGLAGLQVGDGEGTAAPQGAEAELKPDVEPEVVAAPVHVAGKYVGRKKKGDKMDFAQPIVFFQLACLTRLALSPIGSQLTHLTFRLPRRNLLTALTEMPSSSSFALPTPFPSLRHLDLSTTHIADDLRVSNMLKLYTKLETLVLDRCEGLISRDAVEEPTALATLRWLGKCCGGVGLARADDIVRIWRRVVKDRPTDAPSLPPTSTGDVIPPVRDVLVLPPPCTLRSLGLGLHDRLSPRVIKKWERAFRDGYEDALDRAEERAEEVRERWERWSRTGKLEEATRRVVVFRDALGELEIPPAAMPFSETGPSPTETTEPVEDLDPDPLFARFCHARGLHPLSPFASPAQVASLSLAHTSAYHERFSSFSLCLTPDCSNRPGVPHLTLNPASGAGREDPQERRGREKRVWEQEGRDETGAAGGWRRPAEEHKEGCAHLVGREAWRLDAVPR